MPDEMIIDKSKPVPLYYQIKEQLGDKIKRGELKPFDRLLSEAEMVEKYKISRSTIRQAFDELVSEGLVFREHGKGTFVAAFKEETYANITATKSISLLIPNIMDDIFPETLRGVEDVAHEKGYNVIICNTDDELEKQKKYLHRMGEQKIGGLIIVPITWGAVTLEDYKELKNEGIPFVFINRFISDLENDYVITDNELGAYLAVSHLIKLGHRNIAHISLPKYIVSEKRLEGYKRALEENDIPYDESSVKLAGRLEDTRYPLKESPGYKCMMELWESGKRPSAIFTFNDEIARDVCKAATDMGLRIPGDVALVGFGDSVIARSLNISLTTVAHPSYETGTLSAKILIDRIEGNDMPVRHCVLRPKLVIRESCGSELR